MNTAQYRRLEPRPGGPGKQIAGKTVGEREWGPRRRAARSPQQREPHGCPAPARDSRGEPPDPEPLHRPEAGAPGRAVRVAAGHAPARPGQWQGRDALHLGPAVRDPGPGGGPQRGARGGGAGPGRTPGGRRPGPVRAGGGQRVRPGSGVVRCGRVHRGDLDRRRAGRHHRPDAAGPAPGRPGADRRAILEGDPARGGLRCAGRRPGRVRVAAGHPRPVRGRGGGVAGDGAGRRGQLGPLRGGAVVDRGPVAGRAPRSR